jgi:hypothetical protein
VDEQFGTTECLWDDHNPVCQDIVGFSAGGIVMKETDIPTLPKNVGFITNLNCHVIGNGPPGVFFTFSRPQSREASGMSMWVLIFGELELTNREKFQVEVSTDGMKVRICHPDPLMLLRVSEAFYERRWHTWDPGRLARASVAFLEDSTRPR